MSGDNQILWLILYLVTCIYLCIYSHVHSSICMHGCVQLLCMHTLVKTHVMKLKSCFCTHVYGYGTVSVSLIYFYTSVPSSEHTFLTAAAVVIVPATIAIVIVCTSTQRASEERIAFIFSTVTKVASYSAVANLHRMSYLSVHMDFIHSSTTGCHALLRCGWGQVLETRWCDGFLPGIYYQYGF